MAARMVAPGPGNLKGHAAGFSRQYLDSYFGAALQGDVAVNDASEAGGAFHEP